MAQTKKTKAGEKDFSASSTPSRKYLIAAYIGGLALAGYAVRLAWVYRGLFPFKCSHGEMHLYFGRGRPYTPKKESIPKQNDLCGI